MKDGIGVNKWMWRTNNERARARVDRIWYMVVTSST